MGTLSLYTNWKLKQLQETFFISKFCIVTDLEFLHVCNIQYDTSKKKGLGGSYPVECFVGNGVKKAFF